MEETPGPIDITLLVGLPPAHCVQLHRRFMDYFFREHEIVGFEYNERCCSIRTNKVVSCSQALAAAVTRYDDANHSTIE